MELEKIISDENNTIVKKMGWKPIINLDVGLKRTINWYKNFYLGVSANDLIKKDINSYLKNNEDD